ncbi:DUF2584 family protein [Alteribacillus bidgolensis]|uniref:DUF2584 domain-containing protein n=1 Tax=Alteribacillus bidgolensis TaxID=930129 RepID=A0A1G8IKD1_9BACI|nr:DUF2584 family protein [Alteribacillus bidgolensis]SDI19247.1 Protein of unknown function [Alteribacillus bidgolensis]
MGFSMEMNWEIITQKKAERLGERSFRLIKEGYHMFPLDTKLPIQTTEEKAPFGKAIITKMEWGTGCTTLHYELVSLSSVN